MSRRDAVLASRLDAAEAELRRLLVPALRAVASGSDTGLFVTELNNPWPGLYVHTSSRGEAILLVFSPFPGPAQLSLRG